MAGRSPRSSAPARPPRHPCPRSPRRRWSSPPPARPPPPIRSSCATRSPTQPPSLPPRRRPRPPPGPRLPPPPAVTGLLIGDYTGVQAGLHKFSWQTTGPVLSKTDYQNFRAFVSVISLDEAKDWLNVIDPTTDEKIRDLMGTATRAAEKIVGTLVVRDFAGEWINGNYKPVLRLPHGPLPSSSAVTSVTSVSPGGPASDAT